MEELLQESYVDMKARTSDIVSKLAFLKTMERASPDGSHTPALVSVTSSEKAGIVDDDKTAQSSPSSSEYALCASELNDTTHGHQQKAGVYKDVLTSGEDNQEHDHVDIQTVEPNRNDENGQFDDTENTYMHMKLFVSNNKQNETGKKYKVDDSENESQGGKNLSTLV
ncbi:uncharacterized protein LOC134177708 [Corticium candelabrum]|uniref:uncharacterized protein LOC134177708 n=1 Tax=Corticium candelabrum TaxID=121492 RepID=UPI002E25FE8A|nr:uncharacterized protein LOC134177708 [Corticium candelabrum]